MPAVRQHWPYLPRQHVCQSARLQFSMPTKLLADPLHTSLDIRFSHHLPSDCQAEQVHILHPPSEHRSPQRHSAVPLSVLSIVIRHSHHSHGGHRCTARHVISHMATQEADVKI